MERSTDPEARRRTDHIVGMALMAHHTTDDHMIELLDMLHDGRLDRTTFRQMVMDDIKEIIDAR